MEEIRGANRGSYIASSSVHNTRIERLWRDVYTGVSSMYINIFDNMEAQNILQPDNLTDLFCLHYVFIPRINACLVAFRQAWNHHPLSTETNHSPVQLYTQGSIGSNLFDEDIDLATYGIELEVPVPDEEEEVSVHVAIPETDIPLSQGSLQILHDTINPWKECNDSGITLYRDTVCVIYQLMQNDHLI